VIDPIRPRSAVVDVFVLCKEAKKPYSLLECDEYMADAVSRMRC
jgi:hypothetical protein